VFGVGLTTPNSKNLLLRKSSKGKSWIDLTMIDGERLEIQKYPELHGTYKPLKPGRLKEIMEEIGKD
jgi:hypothetical protein